MKTTLMIAAAAASLALAGGAQAQVLGGGLGGNVGGSVGGSVTGAPGGLGVRDTLRGAGDFARDRVSGARDLARGGRDARVALTADADGSGSVDRNGAQADFSASLGANVTSSRGDTLGRAVGFARDSASGARYVLVQGADGAVRGVRTTDLEVQGDGSLNSDLTAYSFRRLPEQGSTETADNSRRSRSGSDVDELY